MDNKRQETNENNSESELLYRNSYRARICDVFVKCYQIITNASTL